MIKLNRALEICNFRPMQERAILDSVPQELIDRLTGKELATVMQALDTHWHKAQAATEQQILDEVCVWCETPTYKKD